MCGVGGYFLRPGVEPPDGVLDRMDEALAHRGPDGVGRFVDNRVGFVHRRLSIIDVVNGAQPFMKTDESGTKVLVANAEIYNHVELRAELAQEFSFLSQSDCETLFAIWTLHGTKVFSRLRGMYAAAMYDSVAGEGVLLRDPFGIKPLYYSETKDGVFFASEPTALRFAGMNSGSPDTLHAACIIDRQYAPDNLPAFMPIRRVAPGETLFISNGQVVSRKNNSLLDGIQLSQKATTNEFRDMLHDSVSAHLMSDVPIGLFFSGGVDSAAILASMAALRTAFGSSRTEPLLAYTCRFDPDRRAETDKARALAKAVGASFVDVVYSKKDFWNNVGSAAFAMDDAAADYAILPMMHLAARAAQDVKVILSGEGGDEFFAGYGRYRAGLRYLRPKFPTRPGPAIRAGLFPAATARRLLAIYQSSGLRMPSLGDRVVRRQCALTQLQVYDIEDWLPNDLLIKLDRCLMRYGLEGRTPFVDRRLSTYGLSLPLSAKVSSGKGKYIVKSWLSEAMPACKPFERKRGFTVPVGIWIAEEASRLVPLVAKQPGITGLMSKSQVAGVFNAAAGRGGLLAWRILFYALWHQVHWCSADYNAPLLDILADVN